MAGHLPTFRRLLEEGAHGELSTTSAQLPDTIWASLYTGVNPQNSVHSPRFGTLQIRQQDSRTGSHTDHGFLLVHGPGVCPGSLMTGHSLYDIAPTILNYSGVEVPGDLDGKPVTMIGGNIS
jgi:predicted AlkP superfamily phosphohydrolase/phosphomutase